MAFAIKWPDSPSLLAPLGNPDARWTGLCGLASALCPLAKGLGWPKPGGIFAPCRLQPERCQRPRYPHIWAVQAPEIYVGVGDGVDVGLGVGLGLGVGVGTRVGVGIGVGDGVGMIPGVGLGTGVGGRTTAIGPETPVIEEFTVSVTVTVCESAELNANGKVPTPLVRALSDGSRALRSLLLK